MKTLQHALTTVGAPGMNKHGAMWQDFKNRPLGFTGNVARETLNSVGGGFQGAWNTAVIAPWDRFGSRNMEGEELERWKRGYSNLYAGNSVWDRTVDDNDLNYWASVPVRAGQERERQRREAETRAEHAFYYNRMHDIMSRGYNQNPWQTVTDLAGRAMGAFTGQPSQQQQETQRQAATLQQQFPDYARQSFYDVTHRT